MSSYQLVNFVGIPLTVLLVAVTLTAFARPDGTSDGTYTAYLGFVQVFSLYALLLALAATAESIGRHLVLGDVGRATDPFSTGVASIAISAFSNDGELAPAIGAGALAVVMAVVFTFHARRRGELDPGSDEGVARVDRAYRGAVCFAMASLAVVAALAAGQGAYQFFAEPVGVSSQGRDLAGFQMVIYGGLLVATFIIFRAHFWDIRPGSGNDGTGGGVATAEDLDR